jgi:hypothetical protein
VSSVEPYEHRDQLHTSHERRGELVETRGDAAVLFQLAEKALDEIAFAIESEIGA